MVVRRRRLPPTLVAAAMALFSCGGNDVPVGVGGPAGSVSSPSPAGGGSGTGQPQVVVATPGRIQVHPIQWDRAEAGADGRTIRIHFTTGIEPCHVLDHVDVTPSGDDVVVTLYEGSDPGRGDVCIELAVLKAVDVVLDRPLAGRSVTDGFGPR